MTPIVTYWHAGPLPLLMQICVASFVKLGYAITCYSYEPIPNLPRGVNGGDIRTVYPEAETFPDKHTRHGVVLLSDIARYHMLRQSLGIWVDTDIYAVRPLPPPREGILFGWEKKRHNSINNAVLYIEPEHRLLQELLHHGSNLYEIPWWANYKDKYLKPVWYRLRGKRISLLNLKWAILGPRAITAMAHRYDLARLAYPRHTFFPLYGTSDPRFLELFEGGPYDDLINNPDIHTVHWYIKSYGAAFPQPGTFADYCYQQVRNLLS